MRAKTGDRHGWAGLGAYLAAHEAKMAGYRDFFIKEDQLPPVVTERAVYWRGLLICSGGLEIEVDKSQVIRSRRGRRQVRTVEYKYHVQVRTTDGVRKLFRYDNADHHKDHPTAHHRHDFESGAEDDRGVLTHVGPGGWPTLGDVLDEAFSWWQANGT